MTTTYTSKLAAGQTAWFLRDNKVVSEPVGYVTIKSVVDDLGNPQSLQVSYGFRTYFGNTGNFNKWEELTESLCFATKEELLASL